MRYDTKVTVYLHSDGATCDCDCGDREWEVQLPGGWMWRDHAGPGPFTTLFDAGTYAASLYPNHPDVKPALPPDEWDYPYPHPAEAGVAS